MVLATEITQPMTTPWVLVHPMNRPTSKPAPIERRMPSGPPIKATHRTLRRSLIEEFEADGEHQKNDANFGEQLHRVDVCNAGARRERADEHARQHVSENDRLAKLPCQHPSANRGEKNVGEISKKQGVGFQSGSPFVAGPRLC